MERKRKENLHELVLLGATVVREFEREEGAEEGVQDLPSQRAFSCSSKIINNKKINNTSLKISIFVGKKIEQKRDAQNLPFHGRAQQQGLSTYP
jgi:hypothetical protein